MTLKPAAHLFSLALRLETLLHLSHPNIDTNIAYVNFPSYDLVIFLQESSQMCYVYLEKVGDIVLKQQISGSNTNIISH